MIRISVTDLDSFLYWKRTEDMEFSAFLKRLRGQEPPSPAMIAGRAFHALLELAQAGENLTTAMVHEHRFVFDVNAEIALPPIRELKAEVRIDTPSGPATLVGKVDALNGRTVHDYKLTERFDAERYAESFQWRSYLMMFEADRFVYDVFQAKYEDDGSITVRDYQQLAFAAYPCMRRDVEREVCELARIIVQHVPEKITAEAA